jgi:hypothetical protein
LTSLHTAIERGKGDRHLPSRERESRAALRRIRSRGSSQTET